MEIVYFEHQIMFKGNVRIKRHNEEAYVKTGVWLYDKAEDVWYYDNEKYSPTIITLLSDSLEDEIKIRGEK